MTVYEIEVREAGQPPRRVEIHGRLEFGRQCAGEIIDDPQASRTHLAFDVLEGHLTVVDLGSSNGTSVNGVAITELVSLSAGDVVRLGDTELVVAPGASRPAPSSARSTISMHPVEALYEQADATTTPVAGDLTEQLISECVWTDEMVAAAGIPIIDSPFVTVGGGLASFAIVDMLRIAGVDKQSITVLSPLDLPHHTYEYLARASQIRDDDRLRSDSMSRIDNIWGFPSYALEEAWRRKTLRPLWTVTTEPILSEFYNPRAEDMFRGVTREAQRIGWHDMLVKGQVRMVRGRHGGGYFAILTPPPGTSPTKRIAYRARHVHLGVGYPSLRFLPDLQDYRTKYNDYYRVVNAYEQHDHVYETLARAPGTVVLRGAGIVASRIIERLILDRDDRGAQTQVVHLFRTWVDGPTGGRTFRRKGGDGFAYQAFTFAKAAGSGQLRQKTMRLEGEERAAFIKTIGGTTTSKRKVWQQQMARGRRDGFYRTHIGEVKEVVPAEGGQKVRTTVTNRDGSTVEIDADFVIDATGLEGAIRDHRLLRDLLECGGATANASGRLDTDLRFEIRGTASGEGRMFASGAIAGGGYLPPADSFWGVEHAAVEICDELARLGFCKHIGSMRSTRQWWRWMRGTPI